MRRLTPAILFCAAVAAIWSVHAAASNPPRDVGEARLKSEGIRKIEGRHLVLFTDVPTSREIDRLPAVFDQAVPQWAEYFGVDEAKLANWRARGYLIADRRRFDALGLMPAGNDQFVNGISFGSELWLYDQPTDYYRRHLLLHEGTHVFMVEFLGGCGPGWYMEGMAELFATHRLDEQSGRLTLGIMPRDRKEVPMLGRVKLIRDAVAEGRALALAAVMRIDNREQLGNEAYAWCWAAAKWLDSHGRYRQRFRTLKNYVLEPSFDDLTRREFADDWTDLSAEWEAFVATLDYDYDFERMAIDFLPAQEFPAKGVETTIAADRGWQSTGVVLRQGAKYRVTAAGRYDIAVEHANGARRAWPCEPGGVTIDYHDGRPLGMLIGAIDGRQPGVTLGDTMAIGVETTIEPVAPGVLYLRVNDSPALLDDNRGSVKVKIEAIGN
jgi:hypothetical protein